MLRYCITDQAPPGFEHAHGSILAQEHLKPLLARLAVDTNSLPTQGIVVLLDFTGIESATASYMKSTILWLLKSGRLSAEDRPLAQSAPSGPEPTALPVYPMVVGISEEIASELDEVLSRHAWPCLEALEWDEEKVCKARLHGPLDRLLMWTLDSLCREGAATASQLHERYPADNAAPQKTIAATGWSNRLADLFLLRLVKRRKEGKQLVYESIAKEVIHG